MQLTLVQQIHEQRIHEAYAELVAAPSPLEALQAFGRMKALIIARDPEVVLGLEAERIERSRT